MHSGGKERGEGGGSVQRRTARRSPGRELARERAESRELETLAEISPESGELETLAERVYGEQLEQDITSQQIFFTSAKNLLSVTLHPAKIRIGLKLEAEVKQKSNISWFEKSLHHQPG